MENKITKFTPGPWELLGDNFSRNIFIIQKMDKDKPAKIVSVTTCNLEPEEWKANVQLISIAPDMFEALTKIKQYIALDGEQYTDGEIIDLIAPQLEILNKITE
jgi:hypothetical protein